MSWIYRQQQKLKQKVNNKKSFILYPEKYLQIKIDMHEYSDLFDNEGKWTLWFTIESLEIVMVSSILGVIIPGISIFP